VVPPSRRLQSLMSWFSRNAGRQVRRTDCTLATVDHNVPYVVKLRSAPIYLTHNRYSTSTRKNFSTIGAFVEEPESRAQCVTLEENVKEFGVTYVGMADRRQGEH